MGLPNAIRILAYSVVMSKIFWAPPHISAQSATAARSTTRASGCHPFPFSPPSASAPTAPPPLSRQLLPEVGRHAGGVIHHLADEGGGALVLEELPRRGAEHLLFLVESEVHGGGFSFREVESLLHG